MTNHSKPHKYSNSINNNYHKKMFKKHIRAVFLLLALLGLFYFSIPIAIKLTGFTIIEQVSPNTALITLHPEQEIGIIRNDFYGVKT